VLLEKSLWQKNTTAKVAHIRPVLRGSTTARGASNADQITSSISTESTKPTRRTSKFFVVLQALREGEWHEIDETGREAANTEPAARLRGVAVFGRAYFHKDI